ncbi:ATP-binding cassette domain-containing protein [Leeuwenhoekiella sp. A16]|uniref:ATP-binding cassette domain-containing protein n=1 Tax=unclassified Leeuwenhoekiella TaxID=2615029 RepID=UPI003A806CC5
MHKLTVQHVTQYFKKREILKNASLELKIGEITGLFGRNGSGKSTLLKIIFGTLKAQSVRLQVDEKLYKPSQVITKQLVGYVPQFSFLPTLLKVRDVIPLFYESSDDQDMIFNSPKIAAFSDQKIGTLSIGERRYLELLIIGNLDHPFLLLDEPFSMVEPLYKEKINEFLISLKAKKAILITDHYYQDVWKISDKKLLLQDGKITKIIEKTALVEAGYLRGII